jgi:hypothetical protein
VQLYSSVICFEYNLCCVGKARSSMEEGISVIFMYFVVHWHFDLKGTMFNCDCRLIILFVENTLQLFLFPEVYLSLIKKKKKRNWHASS